MIPFLLLSGCASLGEYYDDIMSDEREDLIVYKKGKNYEETQYNLEIPPDLITPESTNIMEIPEYAGDKGIDIYYNSRDHRFSSSGLRKQVKKAEDK